METERVNRRATGEMRGEAEYSHGCDATTRSFHPGRLRRLRVAAIAGSLLATFAFAAWIATGALTKLGEDQARESIRMMVSSASAFFSAQGVASLTGSRADEGKEAYIRLRDQLRGIRQANEQFRFVYLMGLRNGRVVFLVDAESSTSEDFSAPGDPYGEASPELLMAFETGQPFVEGPIQDRWGEWVSGHSAIRDPETGAVLAVLGIDIDAEVWREELSVYRWLGLELVGTVVVIGLLCLLHVLHVERLNGRLRTETTERRGAEKRLKEAYASLAMKERELSSILRNTPDVVYRLDRDGKIRFISDAVKVYGYEPNELIGRSILDFVHPEDREEAKYRLTERRSESRGADRIELRLFASDNTIVPAETLTVGVQEEKTFLINAIGLYSSDDICMEAFTGTQGAARDITARKMAEEEIRSLRGILPICSSCKKIRDDEGYWSQVEAYISAHSRAEFSHAICPECTRKLYPELSESSDCEDALPHSPSMCESCVAGKPEAIEAEDRFRAWTENSLDTIMRFDRRGRHLYVNPIVEAQTGIPPEEFIGKTHAELGFPENLVSLWEDAIQSVFAAKAVKRIDFELPSGIWIDWLLMPEFDDAGNVATVITAARDITAYKVSQQALSDSEERYRTLFHSASDAVFLMDGERFVECNNRTLEMFGCTHDQIVGQPPYRFSPKRQADGEDSRIKAIEKITKAFEGEPQFFEWKHCLYDGTPFDAEVSLNRCECSGKTHLLAIVRDITERKIAERERRNLEAQLRQVQRMESIGTLAGGIAHDFNNLLSAILGYADLAMASLSTDSEAHSDLEEVVKAGHRAKKLVLQILTFSRQTERELRPLKLAPLITETLKLIRSSIPSTIAIHEHIDRDCPPVLGDPTQVHQVVMNLCTNAFQAMEESGGDLTVTLAGVETTGESPEENVDLVTGRYARLVVADSGQGMDAATRQRVFEPYFSTKQEGKGTGLGLSIVHGIVKSCGGSIHIGSELGKGSEFIVYLPVADHPETLPGEEKGPLCRGNGERILVVDDEEAVLGVTKRSLEYLGYRVTSFSSPEEALNQFRTTPSEFDLILTDNTMPAMTGFDLARGLLDISPDLPVILTTGLCSEELRQRAFQAGFIDVIGKPVVVEVLAEAVHSALGNRTDRKQIPTVLNQ